MPRLALDKFSPVCYKLTIGQRGDPGHDGHGLASGAEGQRRSTSERQGWSARARGRTLSAADIRRAAWRGTTREERDPPAPQAGGGYPPATANCTKYWFSAIRGELGCGIALNRKIFSVIRPFAGEGGNDAGGAGDGTPRRGGTPRHHWAVRPLGEGGRMWAHGERETERQTGNPARRRREAGDRAADGAPSQTRLACPVRRRRGGRSGHNEAATQRANASEEHLELCPPPDRSRSRGRRQAGDQPPCADVRFAV